MKKILQFALPVILIIFGVQLSRDYFGATGKERRAELEQLIAEGVETAGTLSDEYVEKTTKIKGLKMKSYEVNYNFSAEGQNYSGKKTLDNPPTMPVVPVTYLASDPQVSAVDPAEELSSLTSGEGDTKMLLVGIALVLAGAGLGYYRYRKTFQQQATA